jgi:hypothetical protein
MQDLRRDRIFYFDTFIEAALYACTCSLISLDAVYRIAQAAIADLVSIAPVIDTKHAAGYNVVREQLQGDCNKLNRLIKMKMLLAEPLEFPTNITTTTTTTTATDPEHSQTQTQTQTQTKVTAPETAE